MNHYETVFILNPVLAEEQSKDAVEKFVKVLAKANATVVNTEHWGLKKMAYPIQNKSTGYYNLIEFTAAPEVVSTLETEFRRDESVMRFLTVAQDKHFQEYAERRRNGEFNRAKEAPKERKRNEKAAI
ncbi:MAG: 30S ribosomal protein S6 [Candidatus Nephrothrix sp. EaCA]|nr:MAG: 30S ribosomal protein S6 [Candidatus Nephrothrix sp. EaCA]